MTSERRQRLAGVVLLFGLFYVGAELISANAWVDPPYDFARNYISDLGFSDCAGVGQHRICSPLHQVMNAGFMVQGSVFTIGALLVVRAILELSWQRVAVALLLVLSGVGTFFVGIFHQSLDLYAAGLNGLHLLAATLAIGPGNLGLLLLGLFALRARAWRLYGTAVAILGVAGIIGSVLLIEHVDFGPGIGLTERLAVYPLNIWTIGSGVGLLVTSYRGEASNRPHTPDS